MTISKIVFNILKGKKLPIGHISHRKDGDYKKIKETGDKINDWKKITKDKTDKKEEPKKIIKYHILISHIHISYQ